MRVFWVVCVVLMACPGVAGAEDAEPPWRCTEAQIEALAALSEEEGKKASDAAAKAEWRRSRVVRQRVHKGLPYYKQMRWLYIGRGICDVETFLTDGLVKHAFLGRHTVVHVEVARRLTAIEAGLAIKPRLPMGSLQIRTIRGPFGPSQWLSNHAMGRALDFDSTRNPFMSVETMGLLEEISGVGLKLGTEHDAGARWDSFRAAADAYRKNLRPWVKAGQKRAGELARAVRKGDEDAKAALGPLRAKLRMAQMHPHLRLVMTRRFLSVSRDFVIAMESGGMTWCTDFRAGADLMHFEWRR